MSGGGGDYIQKAIRSAEQATTEDKAQNYEAAAQHYITAADWLMQSMKYGAMNDQMKQNICIKVNTYLKRVEEINDVLKNGRVKKKAVDNTANGHGSSTYNKDDNDRDRKRMMQEFDRAIVTDLKDKFTDVVGLEQAKEAMKENVILPITFPQLFQGKRKPWAGILLYGPSGTGKSCLVKAAATECRSTFISVSSSDILSKWPDESDKGVRCLFELARQRQPCIVFIDEIDALCGQRNDAESKSSRRAQSEFLVQMQNVGTDNAGVLVLAATNMPWELDTAVRRCFEKRIYVPLPGVNEREAMFKLHLGTNTLHTVKQIEWMQLARRAEHYSGADIATVCREALLRPIRRLGSATHFKRMPNPNYNGPRTLWLACSPGDPDAERMTLDKIRSAEVAEHPVTMSDMMAALATRTPTVREGDLLLQKAFDEEYGHGG